MYNPKCMEIDEYIQGEATKLTMVPLGKDGCVTPETITKKAANKTLTILIISKSLTTIG